MTKEHPKWLEWKAYRTKEKRQRQYTEAGETRTISHLNGLSGGNDTTAEAIINQSMNNQWQGLFPLKNHGQSTNTNDPQRNGTSADRLAALRNW